MVSTPTAKYRLPNSPEPASRLLESSLRLWLASWRQTFWYALLYGIAGVLPLLTLGDLTARVLRSTLSIALATFAPWLPRGANEDALAIADAAKAWLVAPQTWMLLGAAVVLAAAAITLLIYRQHRIACSDDPGLATATRLGLARVPASIVAWLAYAAILGLLTLPLLAWMAVVFWLALGLELSLMGLGLLCAVFLLGATLLSIPMVWGSVAFGFAPFVCAMQACNPLAAQRRSMRWVRGHWTHAAIVISVPMLVYLGIGGTLSSFVMIVCGSLAFVLGGWPALMSGGWLGWSQLVSAIPMAMALPLAFAGGVVAWHDLGLRHGAELREPPAPV